MLHRCAADCHNNLCDLHLPHRADQVIDCVLWNVGSLKRSQQILVSLWFFRLNILNRHVSDQQILNMITLKCVLRLKKFHGKKKKKSTLHLVFFHPVNVSSTLERSEIKLILINQNQFLIYLHISLLNILNKCIGN